MTPLTPFDRIVLVAALACLACSATLSGCFKTSDVLSNGDSALGNHSGPDAGDAGRPHIGTAPDASAVGSSPQRAALPPDACTRGGLCTTVWADGIDKVDLLFAIDNSGSMAEEQALLRDQFPRLIERLTSGDHDGDGAIDGPAARDLNLGVVSSDLGLVGFSDFANCGGLGDNGIMQNAPRLPGCDQAYPRFLSYIPVTGDAADTASDLACVAALGTEGCGFEQPLESALKALWPAADPRVTFLADENGFGTMGHGDNDNRGFVRSDPIKGQSVVAIIMLTDEDDCSSKDTRLFTPSTYLDPGNAADAELLKQGLGVRCNSNPGDLFEPNRYVNAFKALQPGREDLVVFAAIAGVPPNTVGAEVLHATDFDDPASRDELYAGIERDPAMQPLIDDHGTIDVADDTMRTSCSTSHGTAFPPSRIVEVAKGFGKNGIVQSICEDDYGPAIDAIAERIGSNLGGECLAAPLTRNADDLVACDVIWELPAPGTAANYVPTQCEDRGFLLPLDAGAMQRTADGGARCRVPQLQVVAAAGGGHTPVAGQFDGHSVHDGWYYDDYSADAQLDCRRPGGHRIAFTPDAHPPVGVRVVLDCEPSAGQL